MTSLIAPVLWTVVVALTLWPPARGSFVGLLVYLLTMAINEIPLPFLVLNSLGMLSGLGDRPSGALGVAWALLWGFVIAGLGWVQLRAGRARPALDEALAAELGRDWRSSIRTDLADAPGTTTPWLAGTLWPFQRRTAAVQRTRNVPYGPDRAHRLDVYHSRTATPRRPILIHFHGGGFVMGAKSREAVALLNQLAAQGWLCLSANYRLRHSGRFPSPLVDAKRVIAWARAHAARYDADPDHVFLAGGSAGAHLALNAALTPGDPRYQPGFTDDDTSVTAVVSLYGYLGRRTQDPDSSPVNLTGPHAPPMLLVWGRNDTVVPVGRSRVWAERLRARSQAPVVDAELPDTQHGFDLFASVRARVTADAVEAFFAWVRSNNPAPGSGGTWVTNR